MIWEKKEVYCTNCAGILQYSTRLNRSNNGNDEKPYGKPTQAAWRRDGRWCSARKKTEITGRQVTRRPTADHRPIIKRRSQEDCKKITGRSPHNLWATKKPQKQNLYTASSRLTFVFHLFKSFLWIFFSVHWRRLNYVFYTSLLFAPTHRISSPYTLDVDWL